MTIETAKAKLHALIDHAGEKEIFALLSLIEGLEPNTYEYDEQTLQELRERSEAYIAGKMRTFSAEESLKHIQQHRNNKNAI